MTTIDNITTFTTELKGFEKQVFCKYMETDESWMWTLTAIDTETPIVRVYKMFTEDFIWAHFHNAYNEKEHLFAVMEFFRTKGWSTDLNNLMFPKPCDCFEVKNF